MFRTYGLCVLVLLTVCLTACGTPPGEKSCTTENSGNTTPTSGFVTLWFDDGVQSTYDVAYPALSERCWVAVLAVVADREIANEKFSWDGDPVMSWEAVRELASAGWEISSHSMTHPHLNDITEAQVLETEVADSRRSLENLGFVVSSFAFPYGEQGGLTGQALVEASYLYWRSSSSGVNYVPSERHLTAFFLTADTDRKMVEEWIAEAEQTGGWLIIGLHAILDKPTNPWQHTPEQFEMVLETVADSSLEVVLPREMFARFGYAEGAEPHPLEHLENSSLLNP